MFKLDLRTIDKASLVEKLRRMEGLGKLQVVARNPDQTLDVDFTPHEPQVLTDRPLDPNSIQGMAQLDRTVTQTVVEINSKMGITGAPLLGDQFRNQLAEVKKVLDSAGAEMTGAMNELKDTASQATAMVKQVKSETADLKAALGLTSNNPPA